MIISRTPFRVSFFGGGTDYPVWFEREKGAVLVTTIDKYCYVTCRPLPPFFENRHRIVYSRIENASETGDLVHSTVRESLRFMRIEDGVEIHHDGDLPARAGLGSSSAFTVGLLNSLYAMQGRLVPKLQLAREAIYVERELAGEAVGSQDQISTALGGFNRIEFSSGAEVSIDPLPLSGARERELEDSLLLYFTGFTRIASEIAAEQVRNTHWRGRELREMYGMVDQALSILSSDSDLDAFGKLLHESWMLKQTLSPGVTNAHIDALYERACASGALGGKLLGAGGGGFLLLFARPDTHARVHAGLGGLLRVPFRFERHGTQIIFCDESSRLTDAR